MINIQEFRTGNFVMVDNMMRKVCSVSNCKADDKTSGICYDLKNECLFESDASERLQPVNLNETILLKLGFVFQTHYKLWQRRRPDQIYSMELDNDFTALDFSHRPIRKNIQHLHILQNLFFIVQGEELITEAFELEQEQQAANKKTGFALNA